jgi:hypothetical protein
MTRKERWVTIFKVDLELAVHPTKALENITLGEMKTLSNGGKKKPLQTKVLVASSLGKQASMKGQTRSTTSQPCRSASICILTWKDTFRVDCKWTNTVL